MRRLTWKKTIQPMSTKSMLPAMGRRMMMIATTEHNHVGLLV